MKKKERGEILLVLCHVYLQIPESFVFVDGGSWLSLPPFAFDYCQAFYVLPVDFGPLSERLGEGVREI